MEIWDIYDIDRNKTNKTHVCGTPLEVGAYHIVVHVWMSMAMPCLVINRHRNETAIKPVIEHYLLGQRGSKQHHI